MRSLWIEIFIKQNSAGLMKNKLLAYKERINSSLLFNPFSYSKKMYFIKLEKIVCIFKSNVNKRNQILK